MARTLIHAPTSARRGEVIEIRATIAHPMETGFRPGEDGKVLPRNIIERFSCRYNGELVFSAELFSAIAANPYLAFHMLATESGTLTLQWEGDHGFTQTENLQLSV
jgi:sulfur-oxidizing protein SoxZ